MRRGAVLTNCWRASLDLCPGARGTAAKPSPSRHTKSRCTQPLELLGGAVAVASVARMVAAAEPDRLVLLRREEHRGNSAAFVRAVAERLICASAASAPGIGFPGGHRHLEGTFLGDDGFAHGKEWR